MAHFPLLARFWSTESSSSNFSLYLNQVASVSESRKEFAFSVIPSTLFFFK